MLGAGRAIEKGALLVLDREERNDCKGLGNFGLNRTVKRRELAA